MMWRAALFDDKVADDWVPLRFSKWGEAWRAALCTHISTSGDDQPRFKIHPGCGHTTLQSGDDAIGVTRGERLACKKKLVTIRASTTVRT